MQLARQLTLRHAPSAACTRRVSGKPVIPRRQCRAAAAPQPQISPEFLEDAGGDAELAAYNAHQAAAARPSAEEQARTWLALAKTGVLATISTSGDASGFPQSSVVEFGVDGAGRPIFATSTMSAHTADLANDGRVSLTVMSPGFKGLNDGRVTLQGRVRVVRDDEKQAARTAVLEKNPNAFWVDFGDFRWFVMEELKVVRFNGGFGAARAIAVDAYTAASPDPVSKFGAPVCGHMNDDHQADTIAMIGHYTGLGSVESVTLTGIDKLGMDGELKRKGQTLKLRLPFVNPALDRKGVKEAIVEMTKAARSKAAPPS